MNSSDSGRDQPETVKVVVGEFTFIVSCSLKKIVDVFTTGPFQTKVDAPVALRKLSLSSKDIVEKAMEQQRTKNKINVNSQKLWSYFL